MSDKIPENKLTIRNSTAEFLIFTQQAGEDGIEVRYEEGTIWLTQKLMAELFDVDRRTIGEHLQNIYSSGELQEDSVSRKFRLTASDGKNYPTQFYNLDAIISVGYRVNSKRATQFRQWATQVLSEFAMFTNCNVSLTVHQKYGQFSIQISNGLSYYLKTGHNGRVYYLLNFGRAGLERSMGRALLF